MRDEHESVGMAGAAVLSPDTLESLAGGAESAAHKRSLGAFHGNVHAVIKLDVAGFHVGGVVMDGAVDAIVAAQSPFLADALVGVVGVGVGGNVDSVHWNFLSFVLSEYSIARGREFVNPFS